MSFYDENKTLEVCPYNKAHVVRRSKMPMHILKCERHAPKKLPRCSFNSTHILQEGTVEIHEQNCPDRYTFDRFFSTQDNDSIAAQVVAESKKMQDAPMPEVDNLDSWDHARFFVDRPILNVVHESAQQRDIFMNIPTAPPAERKLLAEAERKRRSELSRLERGDISKATSNQSKKI